MIMCIQELAQLNDKLYVNILVMLLFDGGPKWIFVFYKYVLNFVYFLFLFTFRILIFTKNLFNSLHQSGLYIEGKI